MTSGRVFIALVAGWFMLQARGPSWNPGFEVRYIEPIRTVELRPPSSPRRIRCESQTGWIEVGVPDVLARIDARIEAQRAEGRRPSVSLGERRTEISAIQGAVALGADCALLRGVVADLLESGRAVVFDSEAGRHLGHIAVSVVAWDDNDTRGCHSNGRSRIFTRRSGHYLPGPDMHGCGPDCLFETVDQQMHVTHVI